MTVFIDKKFINMISPTLRNFKWKKEDLANCSCPLCGDSEKKKTKARGYFYEKSNKFLYKCHNCGAGMGLYNFLKKVSPSLCKEYSVESYAERGTKQRPKEKEMFGIKSTKPKFKKKDKLLDELTCLTDLSSDHMAVRFANMRKIPKQFWKLLYYTDDFTSFGNKLDPENTLFGKEERLVIPFFNSHGNVVGSQGRVLTMAGEVKARETLRYITIKAKKSIDSLWYGLWRIDPKKRVYVVEGPIDSFFLENAIAMVGASSINNVPSVLQNSEITWILDNEKHNKQIVEYNKKLIDMGRDVFIWPDNIQEKDLNDLAFSISVKKIKKMIDENTFNGLEATIRLNQWKRV